MYKVGLVHVHIGQIKFFFCDSTHYLLKPVLKPNKPQLLEVNKVSVSVIFFLITITVCTNTDISTLH